MSLRTGRQRIIRFRRSWTRWDFLSVNPVTQAIVWNAQVNPLYLFGRSKLNTKRWRGKWERARRWTKNWLCRRRDLYSSKSLYNKGWSNSLLKTSNTQRTYTGCSEMKVTQNLAQTWLIFFLRFFKKPSMWSSHP